MAAHARLSPSSASRWLVCPGSVMQCEGIEDETSEWAAGGSAAHIISDVCLSYGFDPENFIGHVIGKEGFKFEFTREWARFMEPGIERIRDFGGEFYGERRVNLDKWMPGQFGTLDRGVVTPKLIVIGDLKWGEGVPVSPIENEQLMIYALGFWWEIARHRTEATEFLIIIDQPRADGGGGEWRVSLDKLLRFGEKVKKRAARTYDRTAPLKAGLKQCRFCPAAQHGKCPEFERFNMELMDMTMKDIDVNTIIDDEPTLPRPVAMTPERRSYIVKHAQMMRKWLDTLQAETVADAQAGRPTPGLKAVPGRRGHRKWRDEKRVSEELAEIMGSRRFNKTLKTPPQVEKEISSREFKRLTKFIEQEEGRPILVSVDDARDAIATTASKFKNLDEKDENHGK